MTTDDELVARLREHAPDHPLLRLGFAADTIERLTRRVEELEGEVDTAETHLFDLEAHRGVWKQRAETAERQVVALKAVVVAAKKAYDALIYTGFAADAQRARQEAVRSLYEALAALQDAGVEPGEG